MGKNRAFLLKKSVFSVRNRLFFSRRFCQAGAMQKHRWLKDEYRFPGFVPLLPVKGVFGDPRAIVISPYAVAEKNTLWLLSPELPNVL